MLLEFVSCESTPHVASAFDFSMAIQADRNAVVVVARAPSSVSHYVMNLDALAAPPKAYAAMPARIREQAQHGIGSEGWHGLEKTNTRQMPGDGVPQS